MAISTSFAPFVNAGITIEKNPSMIMTDSIPDANQIRVIHPSEYKAAAASLAEAFSDDHVVRYPLDTPDRANMSEDDRWNLHCAALEYITYAHCVKGLVTTIGPNYDCVALW